MTRRPTGHLPARRHLLQGGLGAALAGLFAPLGGCAAPGAGAGRLGFGSVPVSRVDGLQLPPGYEAQVLAPWGDPVGIPGVPMPSWRPDASQDALAQALQFGMHHDGLHFFPLPAASGERGRGLLAINHEYVDPGLLFPDGLKTWTAAKLAKTLAAHGVSVAEVAQGPDGGWQLVRPSPWARRISTATPMLLSGPAAGHGLLRTAADPSGRRVVGTLGNCGAGLTPWGTFLTGEENWMDCFAASAEPDAHQRRWGLRRGEGPRWQQFDERFDASLHPHEPHRFGWIVEIDPYDPLSAPVKRTALGRAAHEGATVALTRDGRAVVYMGEDARFEYLYKFVSRAPMRPGGGAANRQLLDEGTLYVARFEAGGRGRWLPLRAGEGPLTADRGFADAAQVLVHSREASDLLGATPLDRPEWVALDPARRELYVSLTNNQRRGRPGEPGIDAANPRVGNEWGQILRWREAGDFDAAQFDWEQFVLAGDPGAADAVARGTVRGDGFACPDGLWIDARGLLWISTDQSAARMGTPEGAALGHNALLAADPASGEVRRFLTGPTGCEIAGVSGTPDGRTLFVSIQHPGEPPGEVSDPDQPTRHSRWPDGGRPRSAVVAVRRRDGGTVGT